MADEPTLSVSPGLRSGELIEGRYRLVRLIGAGGMGEVYEAEHMLVGKYVAVKILSAEHSQDVSQVERFQRETRVASLVQSPHIVDVIDAGQLADGTRYFVMELLKGVTLAKELEACGPLPIARACALARQIATGLAAAHTAGIVHRDLKPDNIFLVAQPDRSDHVKILDFGVSKIRTGEPMLELTRTGMAIGTPMYMSPEQSEASRDLDARTDVWSLGVILFKMLTGEPPFTASNYARLMIKIVTEAPPRPSEKRPEIGAVLEQLVLRCLEKDPANRPPSADALIRALDDLPAHDAPAEPGLSTTLVDAEVEPRPSAPLRPVTPPPRPAAKPIPNPIAKPIQVMPSDLPFDRVALSDGRHLSALAFFELPLSERIQHVIARTVMFFHQGVEVDRQEALARMRVRSARTSP